MTDLAVGSRPANERPVPTVSRRPRWRPRPSRRQLLVAGLRVGLLTVVLGVWELISGPVGEPGTVIADLYVSKPTDIVRAIERWHDSGILYSSIWITAQETVAGFAIGCALGLLVGFLLGVNGLLSAVMGPYLTALNSVPRLALIPLFLLWFGLGLQSKIAIVTVIVFFLVFYSTFAGVLDVDSHLKDVLRLMAAPSWKVHLKVTLPSAMSWIISGLRVSVPYALVAAVTAEMVASNRGMGYLIYRSSQQFYTAGVYAGIVVLMVLALILNGLVTRFESHVQRWKAPALGSRR